MISNKTLAGNGTFVKTTVLVVEEIINNKKMFPVLVLGSFFLFLFTIATVRITSYPADAFYYARSLPLSYWAGIAILLATVLLYIYRRPARVSTSSTVTEMGIFTVLMLYLFSVAAFIYPNPRFSDVYAVQSIVNMMTANHFASIGGVSGDFLSTMYLNSYPGSTFFFSALDTLTALNTNIIMGYYPVYLMFILSVLTYVLARRIYPAMALLAPVCMLALSWTGEYHMSPQSYALILYICFFFLFLLQLREKTLGPRIACTVLFAAIVMSHVITPVMMLFSILFIFAALIIVNRDRISKYNFNIFYVYVVMFIGWTLIAGQDTLSLIFSIARDMVTNLSSSSVIINGITYQARYDYALINEIRIAIVALEVLFGLIIAAYFLFKGRRREATLAGAWFLSCGIFHGVSILSNQGILGRFLIFAIFPFSLLVLLMFLATNKGLVPRILKASLIVFILLSALLIPLTLYGIDYFEFVSEANSATGQFLDDMSVPSSQMFPLAAQASNNLDVVFVQDPLTFKDDYFVFQNKWYNMYEVRMSLGDDYASLFDRPGQNMLYTNGEDKIYRYANNTPA